MDDARLILGDSLTVLPTLEAGSVDAVCSDPPGAINFMNRSWDSDRGGRQQWVDWLASIFRECLRVLKPGGYAFVWALPRTSHWTATALEDAGFKVRDRVAHITGQGFPKGKGCLKPAVEDWWLARKPGPKVLPLPGLDECRVGTEDNRGRPPRTPNRIYGNGEGTNLTDSVSHPAGRWPPNCVWTHDARCERIGTKKVRSSNGVRGASTHIYGSGKGFTPATGEEVGYADADGLETVEDWICHPECPVFLLGEQSGERPAGTISHRRGEVVNSNWRAHEHRSDAKRRGSDYDRAASTGTAARFFPQFSWSAADDVPFLYCSKASKREREAGLEAERLIKLRDDLTEEQRQYVLSELARAGVSF